jgi:polar amino acid transport system substrate-binding protein
MPIALNNKYGFTTVTFDDSNNMYQDVITGNSAACFEDQPVMQYGINNGMALKLVGKPAREGSYGFAASKNNQALISKFNTGLKKLRANGQYDKIIEHYLGNGSANRKRPPLATADH